MTATRWFREARRPAILALTAATLVATPVLAQAPNTRLVLSNEVDNGPPSPVPFAGCGVRYDSTAIFGSLTPPSRGCAIPGTQDGTMSAGGRAIAPTAFGPGVSNPTLATLGTDALVRGEYRPFSNNNPIEKQYTASSFASYRDYLTLGAVRPFTVIMNFIVSGTLAIDPILERYGASVQAANAVGLSFAGGRYYAGDSSFGSPVPATSGSYFRRQTLIAGDTAPQFTSWSQTTSNNFQVTATRVGFSGYNIRPILGFDFFQNPDNSHLLVDFSMLSTAVGVDYFIDGPCCDPATAQVSSAFGNTFTWLDAKAYDEFGNDISSDAFVGLESLNPPSDPPPPVDPPAVVPEPATVGLMATGLLGVGFVARRRRRR